MNLCIFISSITSIFAFCKTEMKFLLKHKTNIGTVINVNIVCFFFKLKKRKHYFKKNDIFFSRLNMSLYAHKNSKYMFSSLLVRHFVLYYNDHCQICVCFSWKILFYYYNNNYLLLSSLSLLILLLLFLLILKLSRIIPKPLHNFHITFFFRTNTKSNWLKMLI